MECFWPAALLSQHKASSVSSFSHRNIPEVTSAHCSRLQPLLYKKYCAHLALTYSPFSPDFLMPSSSFPLSPWLQLLEFSSTTSRILTFSHWPQACPSALAFRRAPPDALHGLKASWSRLTFSVVFLCPDPSFCSVACPLLLGLSF